MPKTRQILFILLGCISIWGIIRFLPPIPTAFQTHLSTNHAIEFAAQLPGASNLSEISTPPTITQSHQPPATDPAFNLGTLNPGATYSWPEWARTAR
ncbi:MAG: hypothetical protein WDZ49_09240, partial [Litorilinea sp.]